MEARRRLRAQLPGKAWRDDHGTSAGQAGRRALEANPRDWMLQGRHKLHLSRLREMLGHRLEAARSRHRSNEAAGCEQRCCRT